MLANRFTGSPFQGSTLGFGQTLSVVSEVRQLKWHREPETRPRAALSMERETLAANLPTDFHVGYEALHFSPWSFRGFVMCALVNGAALSRRVDGDNCVAPDFQRVVDGA